MQNPRAVGADLDPGADFAAMGRAFEDAHVKSGLMS